jgi:hypothetical protein
MIEDDVDDAERERVFAAWDAVPNEQAVVLTKGEMISLIRMISFTNKSLESAHIMMLALRQSNSNMFDAAQNTLSQARLAFDDSITAFTKSVMIRTTAGEQG